MTADDCQGLFRDTLRHTDVYSIAGTPGQSITVQLVATPGPSPIVPYVLVVDSDGQFGEASGPPPLRFVVSSSQPYQILVASAPTAAQEFGPYQLTLTQTACPTPVALAIPVLRKATLAATDCPDPGAPSIGAYLNPADIYTFQVSSVPTNIKIVMKQLSVDDDISPEFSVLTPDGIAEVTADNSWDCTGDASLACSEARFLALQAGTYTIIAAGGTGQYSLLVTFPSCPATALSNVPSVPPTSCSTESGPGCVVGSLSGDASITPCAAPLPIPGISDSAPTDTNSPADRYSFSAKAGDVISVSMVSDYDAHLYLLGPAPGNPLVAQDDDSLSGDSQLAATLVQAGTYTIIAANNFGLDPEDSDAYTLQVQKCPAQAGPTPSSAGVTLNDTFSDADCVGFGDIPYRTYSFTGTAGQFVTVAMTSDDVDAYLRLFAPNGSVVENDDDLLASSETTDAQVNRILPADGTYFVEVSTGGDADLDSSYGFSLLARTCPTIPVAPGTSVPATITGSFDDTDCQATDGTKFDALVFTPAAAPSAASLLAPPNGCLTALLAEGAQIPDSGCSSDPLDVPLLSRRPYGFIVSANDPGNREPYTVSLSNCPLSVVTYGDTHVAAITGNDCQAAGGTPSEWFLFRGGANLVHFNLGFSGGLTAGFPASVTMSDAAGTGETGTSVSEDDTAMYFLAPDLDALLRVGGQTPADQGPYTLSFDPASHRQ